VKKIINVALVLGLVALTPVSASALGVGIHVGPVGVGVGFHHHRICRFDRFGYRHCWWR